MARALALGRERLAFAEDPVREARSLLAHAAGVTRERLSLLGPDALGPDALGPEALARYRALLERRSAREPMAQILGYRDFFDHRFEVTPDVLDPRPETETLVCAGLEAPFARVLDLGTGSGCILLSLLAARPEAEGLGTDLSPAALAVARQNAERLGLGGRARFDRADWFDGIAGRFDLIVSNPPYIAAAEIAALAPEVREREPLMALTDGGDGLGAYRAIAAGAAAHLAPGGRLALEIGVGQGAAVAAILAAAGLAPAGRRRDLDERERVVLACSLPKGAGQAPFEPLEPHIRRPK